MRELYCQVFYFCPTENEDSSYLVQLKKMPTAFFCLSQNQNNKIKLLSFD